jgi:transposase-like protein
MNVLADLKNRGAKDILIASVDGLNLKGFEEAIKAAFPKAEIQKCIVHQIRNSRKFVNYKDRKPFCADMRKLFYGENFCFSSFNPPERVEGETKNDLREGI